MKHNRVVLILIFLLSLTAEMKAQYTDDSVNQESSEYDEEEADSESVDDILNDVMNMTTGASAFIYGEPKEDEAKTIRIWQKKGNNYIYNGPRVYGSSRFNGANESYSDPYVVCLPQPYSKVSFTVNPTSIIFRIEDGIQENCTFKRVKTSWGGESDEPVKPRDAMRSTFGCKGGPAVYVGTTNGLKVRVHNVCKHSIYQETRTTKLRGHNSNGRYFEQSAVGNDADPYAPWREVHYQTTTINLDECAKLNGLSKKDLVSKLLRCDEWFVNKGGDLLELDEEASKVMFYFLWKTFGFSH